MIKSKSLKATLIGLILILIAIFAVVGFRFAKQNQKSQIQQVQSSASLKAKGPDSAVIRIVGYSDFQCPACAHAIPVLDLLMNKYPGKIQYVFKHFPLRMHAFAPVAHQSAECAAEQGSFWSYYKNLYAHQKAWSALPDPMVSFVQYAKQAGLDMDAYASCMASQDVAKRIMAEKQEGVALDVRSTPTFFINGKMFAGAVELKNNGEAWIRSTLDLPPEEKEPDNVEHDHQGHAEHA